MSQAESLEAEIARLAVGDRAALRRIYDRTSTKLFGVCLRITAEREAAEDALQQTYLKAWRRAATFDPGRAGAMTWLSLIARGTAIDIMRASTRQAVGLGAATEYEESLAATAPDDPGERAALDDCLDHLGDDQRQPILSAFFDGYSYDELARRTDVPLGTMKSRIRRGLLALRKCLEGE